MIQLKETEDQPLVSICIPVYNGERFIDETMFCLINQSYKNLEIIFSDNCSTDRTLEIIKKYNDPRVKIFHNPSNLGLSYNFEKCLTYATGKYMSFLGADDGISLDAMEKGVAILEAKENKDIVLVNSYIHIINDESKVVYLKKFFFSRGRMSSYWAIRSNLLYGSNILGEPNGSLFRRVAYENIPKPTFKNSNIWTYDLDLKLQLLLKGNAYMVPEPLGKFRLSSQSTSSKDLRFKHAKLFRQYAIALYKDNRFNLSFFWVITATINSILLQISRNIFYILFIKNKGKLKPVRSGENALNHKLNKLQVMSGVQNIRETKT